MYQNSEIAGLSTCLKFEIYSTRTKRSHISVMWASITNITSLNNITERIILGVNVNETRFPKQHHRLPHHLTNHACKLIYIKKCNQMDIF